MAKSNDKTHKKRMDKNCHIPDLVQAFSNVENGGLNLVWIRASLMSLLYTKRASGVYIKVSPGIYDELIYGAKPLTLMTVSSNSVIFIMMRFFHKLNTRVPLMSL